jgi:large subunit ribosomal protein L24
MPEQNIVRRIKKATARVKPRIKKNDMVMVVTGRERGKTGKVMRVMANEARVIVERLNVVKRHSKPRGPQSPGGIVEKEAPIPISNVMFFCERCNAPVRVGIKIAADSARTRVCRRCGEQLGNE